MDAVLERKQVVEHFMKKNLLVSANFLKEIDSSFNLEEFENKIQEKIGPDRLLVVFKDLIALVERAETLDLNWMELEKALALYEKGRGEKAYNKFIEYASLPKDFEDLKADSVKIVSSYEGISQKRDVADFVGYFTKRLAAIEGILKNRQELANTISINRALNKKDKENIALIGIVREKEITKNNNVILHLEDTTGTIKAITTRNKAEIYNIAREVLLDEVIGVTGVNNNGVVFISNILFPDVPLTKELKKSADEAYALFLSDLHVGSTNFLSADFEKFLSWISLKSGSDEQKEIAKNVKYIFIAGDLVDGVGIYPGQEKELELMDIYEQYKECAALLKQIPSSIKIVICPGNHDAVRISEPQPPLYQDFAQPIFDLKNVTLVSNPAYINIHSSKSFSGFDVLMYHGYSFDYYVSNVDSIRNNGGYDRADLIMKFLLQRRHLAPTHTSTLYIPDSKQDSLVIERIPDFFVTGHIHKSSVSSYRNITMISGSCWQSKTPFQEKVGHHPEPSKVPIVNLKTRKAKILRFG